MPFSVIIPAYRSPAYLELCLRSVLEGQRGQNEVIVIFDGHYDDYRAVHATYRQQIQALIFPENRGLCQALNHGVWRAQHPQLLLVNEDNVFPRDWDLRLQADWAEDLVLSINQVEPRPSVYPFLIADLGQDAATFELEAFLAWEPLQASTGLQPDGRLFPFVISKRLYLQVGGFDVAYPSPHYCDFDFFLKLELCQGIRFARTRALHFYHFGQKSTTRPDGSPAEIAAAQQHFARLGAQARQLFEHKWGVAALRGPQHSLLPQVRFQQGIRYRERNEAFKLAVIVNFCTLDQRFLAACLQQLQPVASQILVPVCDHFFDGQPEDRTLLESLSLQHAEARFVGFAWEPTPRPPWYWPSLARVVGLRHLEPDIDYVLFLDVDEIVDGQRLAQWLSRGAHQPYTAVRLANYWYFRETCYQAETLEDSAVLIQRSAIAEAHIMDPMERIAIFGLAQGPKQRHVMGLDGLPMVHHYSWVRNEAQMLRKVQTWSHRAERDWESLVRAEFTHPFQGTDFVHGYRFKTVTPFVDIAPTLA